MNAIYINREGERWELLDVTPNPFFPGFWYGKRKDTGQLVNVHKHRLQPLENETVETQPQESTPARPALCGPALVEGTNPS